MPGFGRALANGGRYDDVGEVFGRARPATGFNIDLSALLELLTNGAEPAPAKGISAPSDADADLQSAVDRLRQAGELVITSLSGEVDERCDRALRLRDGEWRVEAL